VFLGELVGSRSPVRTHTPLLGVELRLDHGARLALELDTTFEHGLLLDAGDLTVDGHAVPGAHLAYLPTGRGGAELIAGSSGARVLLIGGTPLGEQIVMWWNFVGRSHDEIVAYRAEWMAEIGAEPDDGARPLRFGPFPAGQPAPLPAPELPGTRMVPRG
jgi:redox-sensitive bicupin YhaK (pirin superfamily)